MEQFGSHWTDFHEILIFKFFRKSVEILQFWLNFDRNNQYFTFSPVYIMTIFRWILLRMGNVSDKVCRENQNTHFTLNPSPPPKIFPFMRQCAKMWWKQTRHRPQHNTAHALFVLDNYSYKHTLIIFDTYCFSTATMVTRTPQYYVIFTQPSCIIYWEVILYSICAQLNATFLTSLEIIFISTCR